MNPTIHYIAGYKYQLKSLYLAETGISLPNAIETDYISLSATGLLTIRAGYAWDGASSPASDTKTFMRGSLEHDALYQLMRLSLLPQSYREAANKRLRQVCLEDGMWPVRAWWVYQQGVRQFGARYTQVGTEPEQRSAPQ